MSLTNSGVHIDWCVASICYYGSCTDKSQYPNILQFVVLLFIYVRGGGGGGVKVTCSQGQEVN